MFIDENGKTLSMEEFIARLTGDAEIPQADANQAADDGMCQVRADIVKSLLDNAELLSFYSTIDVIQASDSMFQYIKTGKVPQ